MTKPERNKKGGEPTKKIWKSLLLLSIVLIICLIVIEATLRMTWGLRESRYPEGIHIPDDVLGYKYKPNFTGNFPGRAYNNISITINSKGLRDYEHSYDKGSSFRILGLGDSVTFGAGVEYKDTYLRQIEQRLTNEGYDIEIIKAGVNSYELEQEYIYYISEGYRYQPDIVIIGVVLNDPRPVDIQELVEIYSPKAPTIRDVCLVCRVIMKYASLDYIMERINLFGRDYDREYFERAYGLWEGETWEAYKDRILSLKSLLDEDGIELVLVIFPYARQFGHFEDYGKLPQEQIMGMAESNDIIAIDLMPHLDVWNYTDYFLVNENSHLNPDGYRITSDVVVSEIISMGLLG